MTPTTIRSVRFFEAASPLARPIADSTHSISGIKLIVTRVELASGMTGEAYLLAFHYSPMAIRGALQDGASLAVGWDVRETGRFVREHEKEAEYFGQAGVQAWALASINIAMWDAWARTLGQPVFRLFGACGRRVPLYGSGGWLSYSLDELLDEVRGHRGRGLRAVKIKVGSPELERDVERVRRVREAVGAGVGLMIDANQGLSRARALELAEAVRPSNIGWFEEPLSHTDYDGFAHLRRRAGIPLAMGEREFDTVALRELVRRQALDLWQPDIVRLGGVEAWRASAALAGAHHVPVLPHFYKEYDVPLAMTVPNALGAEFFDWVDPLITNPIRMEDGFATPNDEPGWGFRFRDDVLTPIG